MKSLACALALLAAVATLPAQDSSLDSLPALRDFESHRITSADPTGRNDDWRDLKPGETLVLADVQGPGCIVHFRDNITSHEPHHLQLHVLRMFWDGETEPSVEAPVGDFFGVGFGFTEKFSSALMCIDQRPGRLTDPAAFGAARNCYIPMPFARSARITITNEDQTEPHAAFPKLASTAERLSWAGGPVTGAVEGETLQIRSKTGGVTELQSDARWSGGRQLWWRDGKVGDRLELMLPVSQAGRYRVLMHSTRAFDYGQFQFWLDSEKLGEPIDLYSQENIVKLVTLGTRELTAGEHLFAAEIVGLNPEAKPRHMLGLDYLKLELARP